MSIAIADDIVWRIITPIGSLATFRDSVEHNRNPVGDHDYDEADTNESE